MIESGTKVTYVSQRLFNNSFSMSVKDGTLIEWGEEYSLVKIKGGKNIRVATRSIRDARKKNALTESILAMPSIAQS